MSNKNDEILVKPEENFSQEVVSQEERAVMEKIIGGNWKKYGRVAMAALGILPWVGSVLSATATLLSENEQGETNKLLFLWVKEHEIKLRELGRTLNEIFERFESFGDRIKERINSDEYIGLVRKTFKAWDKAETSEKKEMLRKLLTNAGGVAIAQDDWLNMFIEWIERYHELHFKVIAEIYKKKNITRREIWINIKGSIPADNSAEADMFKLLIDDLATGRVIRQYRETNVYGQFLKKPSKKSNSTSNVLESPFDSQAPYVLTELGEGFIKYVMNELTLQIENKTQK